MKKLNSFLQLDLSFKLLLVESIFYLAWARMIKNKPFGEIAPKLGSSMTETPYQIMKDADKKIISNVSLAVHIVSKYAFWECMCLVQAIAALKMLEKRKIESTLYLGTAKDKSGNMVAHAWLRSGIYYVTGADVMNQFTVAGKFANKLNDGISKGAANEKDALY